MSSPLESPDILQTFVPLSDIGGATTSMASIKLSSGESINTKGHLPGQQVRPNRVAQFSINSNTNCNHFNASAQPLVSQNGWMANGGPYDGSSGSVGGGGVENNNSKSSSLRTIYEQSIGSTRDDRGIVESLQMHHHRPPLVEFSISSVGRSFIDETEENDDLLTQMSLHTPETPTPNISPSSSTTNKFSETFSNDFIKAPSTPSVVVSPMSTGLTAVVPNRDGDRDNLTGSWDLLELDLDFNDVNFDPSFGGDLEECVFFGDGPLGILPCRPTPPDTLDL